MRRVVITGIGGICPLSCDISEAWARLINSDSGIDKIKSFEVGDLSSQVAGQLPTLEHPNGSNYPMIPTNWLTEKELNRIDKFILFAMAASSMAVSDSGIDQLSDEEKERTGVLIGAGIGGLLSIYETSITLAEKGTRRVSPFFIPSSLINLASGHVSIKYGFKGHNHSVVTACSSGTNAICDAARLIKCNEIDMMVAGGSEAAVCRLGVAGFSAARSLSTKYNNCPKEASRPWDMDRDGFVISEGAGIVILEEYEHAKRRGAKMYAEVAGYGMTGDAHHITSPPSDGDGAYRSMRNAINMAEVCHEDVGYINAHGTSTQIGDVAELRAIERLFGKESKVSVSSTKSAVGHMLGAAGAIEAIFSIMAINDGIIPPTLNLNTPEETFLDLVPLIAKRKNVDVAMSNSFGFGGTNTTLVLKKCG